MEFVDYILLAVLVGIISAVTVYIVRAKRRGKKCIGCPSGGNCAACGHGCGMAEEA